MAKAHERPERTLFTLLYTVGIVIVATGFVLLLIAEATYTDAVNTIASNDGYTDSPTEPVSIEREPNYLGWGTILLGFLTLGSTHYFKLREARRSDRAEAREIADRRQRGDDIR